MSVTKDYPVDGPGCVRLDGRICAECALAVGNQIRVLTGFVIEGPCDRCKERRRLARVANDN